MIKKLAAIMLCLSLVGCVSMSGYEKVQYEKLQAELYRTGLPELKEKDPAMAGVLNLLPGFGNVYLEQWGPFVGNLLFWPISIVWGVPQAVIDSNTINKQRTLSYYTYGLGKKSLIEKGGTLPTE